MADLFAAIYGLLRRRYLIILSCLVLALTAAGAYLIVTPPTYTTSTLVMIDARTGQFSPGSSVLGETAINSPWIDSQIAIIRSEPLLESVVRKLKLHDEPEFFASTFKFSKRDNKGAELDRIRLAVRALDHGIDVSRAGSSYVIEIKTQANNPNRAAEIANSIADAYLTDQIASKVQAGERANNWLRERLQRLHQQTAQAEEAVVEFKSKNNMVASEGKLLSDQQLTDLTTRLATARASTAEAEARLSQIETVLKSDRPDTTINAVSDSLNNPIITKLRTQYLELSSRETEYASRYGSKHSAVVRLRDQLRELRASMQNELRRIAESYRSDYAIAKTRQRDVEKQMEGLVAQSQQTNQARIKLRTLESTAQNYRALYNSFLQRYTEAQQVSQGSEARVISPAYPPEFKSKPRKSIVGSLAVFVGLGLGFGLAFFRELMDRAFRTGRQISDVVGAECVAMVPRLTATKTTTLARLKQDPADAVLRHVWCRSDAIQTIINLPLSPFAEAIRSIKLTTDLETSSKSAKVIGLISAVPGEGKSTMAMALSGLIAQNGSRVVLVDCDLRNPSLSRSLAPKAKVGILDVVLGDASLEETIWTDARTGMAFIPGAVGTHRPPMSEVLASTAVKNLFDTLAERFDYVIVDLSPLAAGVDARMSAAFIDSYLLVVKWGQTTTHLVQHALYNAPEMQGSILGVILNQVDLKQLSTYDGIHAKYRYGNSRYNFA